MLCRQTSRAGAVSGKGRERGFTLIELLITMVLAALVLSAVLPVSYGMYENYTGALRCREFMAFVSGLRREAFLYSERKVVSSHGGAVVVDGREKKFAGLRVEVPRPVIFFRNGTSSGGVISLSTGESVYRLEIKFPTGDLSLVRA